MPPLAPLFIEREKEKVMMEKQTLIMFLAFFLIVAENSSYIDII